MSNAELFTNIDRLIANIDAHRQSPQFEVELARRSELEVPHLADNQTVLRHIAHIIAFANAGSKLVKAMIDRGDYDRVWQNYDLAMVSRMNPCDVAEQHWQQLSSIRSRTKIFQVVMAARALCRVDVAKVLNDCAIPRQAKTLEQVSEFWEKFTKLQDLMSENDIPFVRSTTSLSHLLLHLGYDCIKPDVIVMRVAQRLKIIDDDPKKDKNLRKVARLMQEYAVSRGMRPGVVDMYFLIQEGQSEARDWVRPDFHPVY